MAMEMFKHCIVFMVVFLSIALTAPVHGQNQSGFISIDCGIPENSGYTDKKTGINYTSDATFTETGVNNCISPDYNTSTLEQQFLNVRSFPEGKRNCYTLKPASGDKKFLIRARFMYGNYDGLGKVPSFNLLLGADVWYSVELANESTIFTTEIIHVRQRNYIYVCLENTGSGTPFISALELRPLSNSTYITQSVLSLLLYWRWDLGSTTNQTVRYKDDIYDRIWSPHSSKNWVTVSNSHTVNTRNRYHAPSSVLQTAVIPVNGSNALKFSWEPSDPKLQYFSYFHFAEIQKLPANQIREMEIDINGRSLHDPFVTDNYLYGTTRYSSLPIISDQKNVLLIKKTENSILPPMLNALEIYAAKEFLQLLTDQQDVDAIMNIKSKYGVKRSNWQGDPCAPKHHLWQGLNCSYDDYNYNPPRIISLNLSSSGIAGEISPYISRLTSIQILDLSNNYLTGSVPDFLSQLQLTVLNLTGNNLKGSVPDGLVERQNNGLLSLRVDRNPDLCSGASCKEKNKFIVPLLALALFVSVLLTAVAILWSLKTEKKVWKKNGSLELKNRRFSYSDVSRITNNFETILGKGELGTVYEGNFDETQVAVKMLSPSSVQGYKQFQAEVEILLRVHHKNLTTLVGYCDDGIHMGLIYEFMANGNLQKHLLGDDGDVLSWEGRLKIATEAAQGLEYLHCGCKPPIVHRDVKSTNILLNENFQAKLSDFGLCQIFPAEGGTHVSTTIVGTPGYLDPEYYISNRLTEQSDVYSFGVVLLEIITCKPVIEKSLERTHIIQWVSSKLAKAEIRFIVDPRLQGDFSMDSARKAVELAMACVSSTSSKRPTMNQVLMELNDCLAIEIARKEVHSENESIDSFDLINQDLYTELTPVARWN